MLAITRRKVESERSVHWSAEVISGENKAVYHRHKRQRALNFIANSASTNWRSEVSAIDRTVPTNNAYSFVLMCVLCTSVLMTNHRRSPNLKVLSFDSWRLYARDRVLLAYTLAKRSVQIRPTISMEFSIISGGGRASDRDNDRVPYSATFQPNNPRNGRPNGIAGRPSTKCPGPRQTDGWVQLVWAIGG